MRRLWMAVVVMAAMGRGVLGYGYTWTSVPMCGGGFVSGVVGHPGEKGLFYARTDIGGAYRWDNKTGRWVSISQWIGAADWNWIGVESVAVDVRDARRVYLAVGTYTNRWSGDGAILRSMDQGEHWEVVKLPVKCGGNEDGRNNGERLAVDPEGGEVMLLGTRRDGLWRSGDAGKTWGRVAGFPKVEGEDVGQGVAFVEFARGKKGVVFAGVSTGTGAGICRSEDGGVTWKVMEGQPVGLRVHRAAWDGKSALYVTYGDAAGPNGVTKGAVWKWKGGAWAEVTPLKGEEGFGYSAVAVDGEASGTVMVSTLDRWARGDDILRSVDGGRTWVGLGEKAERDFAAVPWGTWGRREAPNGPLGHWIAAIAIDPFERGHVMYTTGWGMWGSRDVTGADAPGGGRGTHWASAAMGIEEGVINNVVSPPRGVPVLSVMWDLGGFRHEDVTKVPRLFFEPSGGNNFGLDFAEKAPGVVVRTFGNERAEGAVSVDGGVTWKRFGGKPANGAGGTVAVSAEGKGFVWSVSRGAPVWSKDGGETWAVCAGLPGGMSGVVSDRNEEGRFYAWDGRGGMVWVSEDGGEHFVAKGRGVARGPGVLRSVPGEKGEVWFCGAGGVYRSGDGGGNFVRVKGIEDGGKMGFGRAVKEGGEPVAFVNGHVGGKYGIWRLDEGAGGGSGWREISDTGHLFGQINAISGDPRVVGRVYVATANFGIVRGEE